MSDAATVGWNATSKSLSRRRDSAEPSRTACMKDVGAFAEMTGDRDPLHDAGSLAEKSVIGKPIVRSGVTPGTATTFTVPLNDL